MEYILPPYLPLSFQFVYFHFSPVLKELCILDFKNKRILFITLHINKHDNLDEFNVSSNIKCPSWQNMKQKCE